MRELNVCAEVHAFSMNRDNKRNLFSLVELVASIAVLAMLILISFSFFSSAQNTWTVTNTRQETFENARIALELISRDIETAYYGEGKAPFWHWVPGSALPSEYSMYQNGHLAFIGQTSVRPNEVCASPYFEIKYQLYYSTSHDNHEGWLRRSVTGDKLSDGSDNPKYNWFPNGVKNLTGSLNLIDSAFTADSASSGDNDVDYINLIPYVTELSFICDIDTDTNSVIQPDTTTVIEGIEKDLTYKTMPPPQIFPSVVTVSITLMDKSSWEKWILLCGPGAYHAPAYTGEPFSAKAFRESHQITFTRMIYLGDRGQEQ